MISWRFLKLAALGVLAAVAVACGGGDGGDGGADNPEDVVRAFANAFNDRKADQMYDVFAKDCRSAVTKEQFAAGFTLAFALLGDAKIKIDSIDVKESGDTATATVKGKLEGGTFGDQDFSEVAGDDDQLPLRKEDGKWRFADCSDLPGFGGGGDGITTPIAIPTGAETAVETETAEETEIAEETAEETEPAPTGTVPSSSEELPEGYPADEVPIMEGGVVTDSGKLSGDDIDNFSVTFVIEGTDAQAVVDFYKDALEKGGWSDVFAGTTSEEEGSVIAGKPDGKSSVFLSVAPSVDVAGALEVNLVVSQPQ